MSDATTVSIRILDKDYQVQCPPDAQDALQKSALRLDQRMREARKSAGGVVGLERIAVMAALNLSYDLLLAESTIAKGNLNDGRLQRLDERVSLALSQLQLADDAG